MKLGRRNKNQPTGRQPRERLARSERNHTYSYHAQRSEEVANTDRQLNRVLGAAKVKAKVMRHFWLQRFGLVILITVVLISVISILTLSSNAKIVATDSNTDLQNQAAYQTAADTLLSSSIWNHNKITVDTAKISQQLRQEFPELTSVSVTLPLVAHRPLIYVQTAQPALILSATNGQFVLGSTGKVLLRASGTPSLPVVTDQSGIVAQLNHTAMSAADISFIQTILFELQSKQITSSALTLPAHSRELDVQIAGQPYFVKFNLASNDPRQQAGTFLAVYAQLQTQGVTPSHYIDVRVDGRAYYE